MECPFRGGSVEAIFALSYGPGTMKFVISDPKNLYIQMEKVWDDFFFLKIFIFSKLSERKKTILMQENPLGSFSTEGKKKISERGSG